MTMSKPVLRLPCSRLVIFKILIRIYMFWPPMAAFMATVLSRLVPRRKPRTLKNGFYSNKSRGLRKKAGTDDQVPALIESEMSPKEFRKNWARLIQKIYNVDPLLCPKCLGSVRIIAFIEDQQIVKKILQHLDLWHVKRKPPARANGPPAEAFIIYDESSSPSADDYLIDADYPIETYL